MKSIIRKLYDITLEENLLHSRECDREIKDRIRRFLSENKIEVNAMDRDVEDIAFALAEIGEEAGFVQGFRCAFQLFSECMDGK